MKYLAALPLAAILALGTVSAANAWSLPQSVETEAAPMVEPYGEPDIYHHCHGLSSGTASYACGTQTGGPSGGLF